MRGFAMLGLLVHFTSAGASLTVAYMSLLGSYEWSEAEEEMEKAGYPLDPLKSLPPDAPLEGNFGAAPFLRDLLADEATPELKAKLARLGKIKLTDTPPGLKSSDSPLLVKPG